jgi:hypothetical protein
MTTTLCIVCLLSLTPNLGITQNKQSEIVRGQVYDVLFGHPLARASLEVIFDDLIVARVLTDENGFYEINDLKSGKYIMRIKLSGFVDARRELQIKGDRSVQVDIGLRAGYLDEPIEIQIRGKITTVEKTPIAGTSIVVLRVFDQQVVAETKTDEKGEYKMSVEDPGQYQIFALKPRYKAGSAFQIIEPVTPRKEKVVDFVLHPFKL